MRAPTLLTSAVLAGALVVPAAAEAATPTADAAAITKTQAQKLANAGVVKETDVFAGGIREFAESAPPARNGARKTTTGKTGAKRSPANQQVPANRASEQKSSTQKASTLKASTQ